MKKTTRALSLILAIIALFFCFTGCGADKGGNATDSQAEKDTVKIGIIQYMSHPSLDNCYKGIKEALEQSGLDYTTEFQTGSSSSADSDCASFAKNMVSGGCDIIIAIATPAAKAAFSATADTDIPVIFCAVTDPVLAGLVSSNDKPGDLCTGTSDVLNLEAQVDMIQSMQPNAKKIGILYTSSEENSVSNLKDFTKICDERGLTVVPSAVQTAADIPTAADTLASQVDCINNFTDNNVVNNLSVLLSAADKYNIPVYGSEVEQVKNGCLGAMSIDYLALGKVTGQMAIDVHKGADPTTMAVKRISDADPVINKEVLDSLKMELPSNYSNATFVTADSAE